MSSEDFRRLRTGHASCGRLSRVRVWTLFTVPIVAVTACISITKNEKSFYVAAIVKPLLHIFSSLSSSFQGVSHRKYFYCSNVHECSYAHSLRSAWRCQGQTGPVPSSWAQHPMLPVTWPGLS